MGASVHAVGLLFLVAAAGLNEPELYARTCCLCCCGCIATAASASDINGINASVLSGCPAWHSPFFLPVYVGRRSW